MFRERQIVSLIVLGAGLALLLVAHASAAPRRIPAFPGAEGFGATTPGGRGGRIIEVTNLNASGPGSFRAACKAKGPRIIVFRVSGVIPAGPWIRDPFCTVAGQTAPGDGICLRGNLIIQAHDVIVRHVRARPGDDPFIGRGPESRDGIELSTKNAYNVIVDHCSVSWGIDENMSAIYSPRDFTFQWCIFSEALDDSTHPKGPHSKGMLASRGSTGVTIHHCLLAHNVGRNPLIGCRRDMPSPGFDIRNNVIYNVAPPFSQMLGHPRVNYVANFLKQGTAGTHKGSAAYGIHHNNPYGKTKWGPVQLFVQGNVWPGNADGKRAAWEIIEPVVGGRKRPALGFARLVEPIETPRVATQTAEQAYESVLRYAGCTRPVRDVVDARIVDEVRMGTGRIIDSQREVGGYPLYASLAPPADADHDAMPDAWEQRFGFNPGDPSDGPKDRDGDGYTNVEEFLNGTNPTKPDTGAPMPQTKPRIQAGNESIRGERAREIQAQFLANALKPNATEESATALLKRVKQNGKEVADLLGVRFVKIPAGHFMLRKLKVTLTKPFELSVCEITQAQWQAVMGTKPWSGQIAAKDDPACPATYVSYLDCQEFIRRLNACGSRKYRLPTACEWLHAARGGTDSAFGFGNERKRVPEYAWCRIIRGVPPRRTKAPQPVGQLKANPWGLYNMAGNAREWAHDRCRYWRQDLEAAGGVDFMGSKTGDYRKVCGGHFRFAEWEVHRFTHAWHRPHYRGFGMGFRLQRAAP